MPNSLTVANPSKAMIALVGLICITVLMIANAIPSEAGTGMLGAIIGYSIGNGIAGAAGKPVDPIIGFKK